MLSEDQRRADGWMDGWISTAQVQTLASLRASQSRDLRAQPAAAASRRIIKAGGCDTPHDMHIGCREVRLEIITGAARTAVSIMEILERT
jgi:hypothetical protein